MFKYVFEFILIVIIIFFVWNILKRLFFNSFYKNFPNFITGNQLIQNPKTDSKKMSNHKIKWVAESVDYEEVKEEKKS